MTRLAALAVGSWGLATGRPVAGTIALVVGWHLHLIHRLRPRALGPARSAGRSAGRHLTRTAVRIATAAAWLTVLMPVSALARLVRFDLLEPGPRGGWSEHGRRRSAAPFTTGAPAARWSWQGGLAVGLLIAVASSAVVLRVTDRPPEAVTSEADAPVRAFDGLTYDDYGHDDEPWAEELHRELLAQPLFRYDPVLGFRTPDVVGRHVNVEDGVRRSWTPPEPTVTVWFFGGSTMFGIGQRDEHTIPSEVARLAAADGIALRAVNLGAPAFVAHQEAALLNQRLRREPAPDLVVFYDGLNDLGLQFQRADEGDEDLTRPSIFGASTFEQVLVDAGTLAPDDAAETDVDLDAVFESTVTTYGDGIALADDVASANGVPVRFFWQPQAITKRPSEADLPLFERLGIDVDAHPGTASAVARIADRAGRPVTDLTGALDGVEVPVYLDGGHTNELGASIVAAALYEQLRPDLRAVA